jgi:alanine racemase
MIPNEVIIDLGALRHNFFEIKRRAGPDRRILAVVKSDAYGHGMIPVAGTLEAAGVDHFGVFEAEEGAALRNAGCRVPILVMMGMTSDEVPLVIEKNLTPALFQMELAVELSRLSVEHGTVTPVHLKLDSGMARLGIPLEALDGFLKQIAPLKGIRLEGIFTHLAVADQPNHPFTDRQIKSLQDAVAGCRRLAGFSGVVHISNSGALLGTKGLDLDMIRPGILLYGSAPSEGWGTEAAFLPVMTFKSQVIQVKTVPPGTPVSYGCTYVTERRCSIATVPVGYDDGFSRLLSNRGDVLIRGQRAPVLGRVCMNLTMADVTEIGGVSAGDEVVLLGAQGKERITAEEIAERIGTISYEVYCTIGKSNRRVYIDG